MRRRDFLHAGVGALALSGLGPHGRALAQASTQASGGGFDRAQLVEQARRLAETPYEPTPTLSADALPELDYGTYQQIRYRKDQALWGDSESPFRIEFFHPGLYFRQPVAINVVEDGTARPVTFSKELFDYGSSGVKEQVAPDVGFAGFRIYYRLDWQRDVASFLGASYFRAVGGAMQYGLSARGIAIDTTSLGSEEFPRFKSFWLERPRADATALTVHALMDGESVTGLFTFAIEPGGTTAVQVDASLFPRRELRSVGVAPLTSMYYAGENDWLDRETFRQEAHDSDGLQLLRGNGERIWRPLANPGSPRVSAFADTDPQGFGLRQRDRDFDHYQDLGAHYEERPDLWVVPHGGWGKGAVELLELPTDGETFDNVVAYWKPDAPLPAKRESRFRYRLLWGDPTPDGVARVTATRLGRAGRPGKRAPGLKFVLDFAGGALAMLGPDQRIDIAVSASRGEIEVIEVARIRDSDAWRAEFDLSVAGGDTVDLRCYLRQGDLALSETWLYRLEPSDWQALLQQG